MKKKLLKFISVISFTILTPFVVFAADTTTCSGTGITKILCQIQSILNAIIPVLVALGVVYFIWGVVKYFIAGGEEAKTKGKESMIYGIIGLTVIVGLWGIVNLVIGTFGISGQNAPSLSSLTPSQVTTNSSTCTISSSSKLQDYLNYVTTCIINNSVIPLIFAVAVVMFFWGVVKYFIIDADEEAKRTQGKQFMILGIVALAVMLSVWGIVSIVSNTFGITGSVLPQVHPPTSTSS